MKPFLQNVFGDLLSLPGGIAEEKLANLDAFQEEMQVVLPRKADTAVDLHAAVRNLATGIGAIGLCDRNCLVAVDCVHRKSPRGIIRRRPCALGH